MSDATNKQTALIFYLSGNVLTRGETFEAQYVDVKLDDVLQSQMIHMMKTTEIKKAVYQIIHEELQMAAGKIVARIFKR